MKTAIASRILESTVAPLDQASYHFDPSNMKHIAAILREMYSNPVLAVVREYAANGTDAHVQAGTPDRPIEIRVPTLENPTLEFRDYGVGLSDAQVKSLLLGYGSSGQHKRTSNQFIGGFGIGAKCAFAVSDQFTFTSIHAGHESVWSCYRDQDDDCQAVKTLGRPSTQEPGVLVSIPIPVDQISDVMSAISNAFRYYKVKPCLMNTTNDFDLFVNRPASPVCFSGNLIIADKEGTELPVKWEAVNDHTNLHEFRRPDSTYRSSRNSDQLQCAVVMGGIWYPLDLSKATSEQELRINGLVLHAPVATFQLAPSRESLSYTSRVKDTLVGILKSINRDMQNQVLAKVSTAKNCRELFDLITSFEESFSQNMRTSISQGSKLKKELADRGLSPTGFEVRRGVVDRVINGHFRHSYHRRLGSIYRYAMNDLFSDSSDVTNYTMGHRSYLVHLTYTDKEDKEVRRPYRELFSRVCTHVWPEGKNPATGMEPHKTYTTINLCVTREGDTPYTWLKDGSAIHIKCSDLPAVADATWIEITTPPSSDKGRSRSGSTNRGVYSQHGKKFNVLKETVTSWGNTKSTHWGPVKAEDLRDDSSVVFVYHDRFVPCPHQDAYQTWYYMKHMGCFPELDRGLFGLRTSEQQWVEKNKDKYNLVKFEDYIDSKFINNIVANYGVNSEQLEALYYLTCLEHEDSFAIPFIIGAYNHNVTEWDRLLKPFFMPEQEKLVQSFSSFMRTIRGIKLAKSLGWLPQCLSSRFGKAHVEVDGKKAKDVTSGLSPVQQTFVGMLELVGCKSPTRHDMLQTLRSRVQSLERCERERDVCLTLPLGKWYTPNQEENHSTHTLYSMLLCLEETGI